MAVEGKCWKTSSARSHFNHDILPDSRGNPASGLPGDFSRTDELTAQRPRMNIGLGAETIDPFPNSPEEFRPQHKAIKLSATTAQACPPPARRPASRRPPVTSCGLFAPKLIVPVPS